MKETFKFSIEVTRRESIVFYLFVMLFIFLEQIEELTSQIGNLKIIDIVFALASGLLCIALIFVWIVMPKEDLNKKHSIISFKGTKE